MDPISKTKYSHYSCRFEFLHKRNIHGMMKAINLKAKTDRKLVESVLKHFRGIFNLTWFDDFWPSKIACATWSSSPLIFKNKMEYCRVLTGILRDWYPWINLSCWNGLNPGLRKSCNPNQYSGVINARDNSYVQKGICWFVLMFLCKNAFNTIAMCLC